MNEVESLANLQQLEGQIVSVSSGDISAAAYGYMAVCGRLKCHGDFWTVGSAGDSVRASFSLSNVVSARAYNCTIHINPSVYTAVGTLASRRAFANSAA